MLPGILLLISYVIIHKPFHDFILGYSTEKLKWIHHESDIFGARIEDHLSTLDRRWGSRWTIPCALTLASCLFYREFNWGIFAHPGLIRLFTILLCGMFTWKYILGDIDLVTGRTLYKERLILLIVTAGTYFFPGMIIIYLFVAINYFKGWLHHNQLGIRLLQVLITFISTAVIFNLISLRLAPDYTISGDQLTVYCIIAMSSMFASHYWVPAAKKIKISTLRKPWFYHNRLHFIVASAYIWGWLNFLPEKTMLTLLEWIKRFDIPFQIIAITIESITLLILISPEVAVMVFLGVIVMHLLIFFTTGILFWENIGINLFFILLILRMSAETTGQVFTPYNFILFFSLSILLPFLPFVLWRPSPLGWWDTPWAGRIHWEVKGESGRVYGLYNNYMDPHERLFGRVYGWFLLDCKIPYKSLGEVSNLNLRDEIVASEGNTARLEEIREKYGVDHKDESLSEEHDTYLQYFLLNHKLGKKKFILPRYLRFLKAPGGQYYYWGKNKAFKGQEPLTHAIVSFREYFYNGNKFICVKNKEIKTISLQSEKVSG